MHKKHATTNVQYVDACLKAAVRRTKRSKSTFHVVWCQLNSHLQCVVKESFSLITSEQDEAGVLMYSRVPFAGWLGPSDSLTQFQSALRHIQRLEVI